MRTRTSPNNSPKFLKIIRIPAQGSVSLVFADADPTLVVVHRHERRTVECLGDDCPLCGAMAVQQDRIFARIHVAPSGAAAILELPPSHWERLVDVAKQEGGLCAGYFTFSRPKGTKNGPIVWRVEPRAKPWPVRAWPGELLPTLAAIWHENTQFAVSALRLPNRHAQDAFKS